MFKIFALTKFPPEMTLEAARRYWSNVHGPIALHCPLIARYLQDHWIETIGGGDLVFHGNSEIWYADEHDYTVTMASAEWETLVADGPNVFDYSTIVSGIVDEHVLRADIAIGTGCKAMWILKLEGDRERARRHWLEHNAALVLAVPGVRRYEQNHATRSADVNGPTADDAPFEGVLDGLFSLWFDDRQAMDTALASSEWQAVLADTERFVQPGSLVGTVIAEHVKRSESGDDEMPRTTLTEAEAALVHDTNLGALATIRDDGTAHVTPLWVDWDGTYLLVNTAQGRVKERHMSAGRPVTVLVVDAGDTTRYVQITGTPEVTTDGAEAHIDKMAQKYMGLDTYPAVFRAPGEVRVIGRITPTRVVGWNVEPDDEWPDPLADSSS